ncbi:MAG: class I SAM-dependent methyltransferase [Thermincolia bacterium]
MNVLYEHRADMAKFTPTGSQKALDIGCNTGCLGEYLRAMMGVKEIVGVDISPNAPAIAGLHEDKVLVLDIEKEDLPYPDHYFDVMFCGDVLEHLVHPEQFLARYKRYLKPGGPVIASIPNIGHFTVLRKILLSENFYEDMGITDQTHMRFFTKHSAIQLFAQSGYQVDNVEYNHYYENAWDPNTRLQMVTHLLRFMQACDPAICITEDALLFTVQFVIVAYPRF